METMNKEQLPLAQILMDNGKQTAEEWLATQPEAWRPIETEAIYECLKRGWSLHVAHIHMIARELNVKQKPKG